MFSGHSTFALLNVECFELLADKLTADHRDTTSAGLDKPVCHLMDSYVYIAISMFCRPEPLTVFQLCIQIESRS